MRFRRKPKRGRARIKHPVRHGAFFLHLPRLARNSSQPESKLNYGGRKTEKRKRKREREREGGVKGDSAKKRVANPGLTSLFKCLDCQVAKSFSSLPNSNRSIVKNPLAFEVIVIKRRLEVVSADLINTRRSEKQINRREKSGGDR